MMQTKNEDTKREDGPMAEQKQEPDEAPPEKAGEGKDVKKKEEVAFSAANGVSLESSTGSGVIDPTRFPSKLHRMLTKIDAEADDLAEVVSWQPHGRCFLIRDKQAFIDKVMPKFFYQLKYVSFQRQTNLYGFRKLSTGSDKGAYCHDLFLRGMPGLAGSIQRVKSVKGASNARKTKSDEPEPNFYVMPPLDEEAERKLKDTKTLQMASPPTRKLKSKSKPRRAKKRANDLNAKSDSAPKKQPARSTASKSVLPLGVPLLEQRVIESLVGTAGIHDAAMVPIHFLPTPSSHVASLSAASLLDIEPTPMNPMLETEAPVMSSLSEFYLQQQQEQQYQQYQQQNHVQQQHLHQQLDHLQQYQYLQDLQLSHPQQHHQQQQQHAQMMEAQLLEHQRQLQLQQHIPFTPDSEQTSLLLLQPHQSQQQLQRKVVEQLQQQQASAQHDPRTLHSPQGPANSWL